ncbi:MAG: hypothetical protein M1308_17500 [Actinobacteria bacterium]|nr:hypothetical protein [Actinomycetota bacterium]
MADIDKLKKASYMSKRMYILKDSCESLGLSLEYLFGLFNYYNNKNKGRWFWQKATFTGAIKDSYDNFNKIVDKYIKEIKNSNEEKYAEMVKSLSSLLDDLMKKMEVNLNVDRQNDVSFIEGNMDDNLKSLIRDGLKGLV